MIVHIPEGLHAMNSVCLITLISFIVIFGLIIWEKIPRMYLALFGAIFLITIGVFDLKEAINFVSWETIGFLLGMFLLIEILIEAGFFRWVALVLARKLNYEPIKILVFFPLLSFFLSAFINSITVMVFLTVVTVELARLLNFDPVPVVINEVILSNIGGAATLVGDPPNVILGTVLGFGFNDFLIHNGVIAMISALVAIGVSYLMHRKSFSKANSLTHLKEVKDIDPATQIKDIFLLKCGLAGISIALFLLVGKPFLDKIGITLSVSSASLIPALAILTFGGQRVYKHHFMRKIDGETIMFFIGLFIMIGALEKRYIIQMAANYLEVLFETSTGFVSALFWGSGIISAFVDNVPLAMATAYIIKQNVATGMFAGAGILVWATSLGVDLGGNLTPIGASANVVAYSALEKNNIKIGWGRWLKFALPPSLAALLVSYIGILIKLHFKFY